MEHWRRPSRKRGNFGGRGRGSGRGVQKNYGTGYGHMKTFRTGRTNDYGGRGYQNWNKNAPFRYSPGKRLSEDQIGVTQYVSDHEGFLGVIKSRYSDFQVSEINLNGEIAKLTNQEPPEPPMEEQVEEDEDLLLTKYNVELLPMEVWDKINKLAVSEASDEKVEVNVDGMTKEQRTKIHDAVKKAFGDGIVGSTVSVDDKKLVRFVKFKKGARIDNRVKWVWGGEHVHFVVHKENCDTMEAASRIAERLRLHMRPSLLGYAGTKDRRAKTSQWFSARRLDPRRLAAAGRALRDVHLGNFRFSNTHLKLGMLKGNRFRIALRNVTAADPTVEAACQLLRAGGFINYYGLQRFGTRADAPTYTVGLHMLRGEFQEAINGILKLREGPLEYALQQYAAHGAAVAAPAAPYNSIEGRLLRSLAAHPKDLLGALNKLARNTRLLYLHSYQSLVWNRAVSERLARRGLRAAVGDLVPLRDVDDDVEDDSDEESENDDATQDGDNQSGVQPEATEKANEPENKSKIEKVPVKFPVKILTQEDIDSGLFSIFDIIMPLPGHFIDYPPNMVDYYEELLTKDGLTLGLKNKIKSLSMSGAYRRVVTKPIDMTWSFVRYSSPTDDLILSDMDELQGLDVQHTPDGPYKALLLTMSLPASCYATMALRELLKVDTAGDNQALQNNYHKDKIPDPVHKEQKANKTDSVDKGKEQDANKTESEDKTKEQEANKTDSIDKEKDQQTIDIGSLDNVKEKEGNEEKDVQKESLKRKLESEDDDAKRLRPNISE